MPQPDGVLRPRYGHLPPSGAELYPAYREGVRDVDAERPEYGRVYWMYVQDGRLHHGRTPQGVIDELEGDEKPLTDFQGLCTAIMFPQSLDRNMMILAGSIYDHQGDDDGYSLTSLTRDSGNLRPSWTYHGKAINDECGVATGIIGGLDQ